MQICPLRILATRGEIRYWLPQQDALACDHSWPFFLSWIRLGFKFEVAKRHARGGQIVLTEKQARHARVATESTRGAQRRPLGLICRESRECHTLCGDFRARLKGDE